MRITTIGATATAVAVLASPITSTPAPTPATVPAVPAASVVSKSAKAASVHGEARISYIESIHDDIRFTIHAEQTPFTRPMPPTAPEGLPTDARGTLKFSHSRGEVTGWAEATVDCLVTSGRTATLTAVVTKSNVEEPGARLGISVQQGGKGKPDRLGFSWGVVNVDPENVDENGQLVRPQAGSCMAPAPFTTVIKGGYKVVHAEITKSPTQPEPAPHHS
ncbi:MULTISPECIES: hypothetical protein [Streptomyces]|uniref:Repetin n=1 Tax=Streptomyces wadayamensis TaxID=141454 RepID=A0ABR4S7H8_9ACTN|nr:MULTISPECIES: hypothetical protein [Streptomyces]KDR61613.1 hypothetical protein DC60_09945 [Streptomyces wadayamensis]QXQ28499.1 hypothetical protein STALF2_29355 [Streptomyces albidoflavus]QXQ34423.1 hypothetical protein STALF4_29420 [Streptomyces albidoflavus]